VPAPWTILLSRGPYPIESERQIFAAHDIDVLVTKDSGGAYTRAKLNVAAERGSAVVMVRRSAAAPDIPTVTDADAAAAWLAQR
jgi:precorrin-6A/cobalt-precorrin-6A reductase